MSGSEAELTGNEAMDVDLFLDLSISLTGFSQFDLRATGMVEDYLAKVAAEFDAPQLDRLRDWWTTLRDRPANEGDQAIAAMMDSDEFGTPLRRIVMLWYTGSWYTQPPYNATTLSGQSYVQGLMWKAIGAHPMAAAPQGYGAWALPPPEPGA